jgi:glycosyltransferase involved in cell wall biosynthesis
MELASLYRRAKALVFASLYEGFGLPILEAFYHGCLVITSRVSSMPEVAGDAAVLVDPYDVAGITVAMQSLPEAGSAEFKQLQQKMQQQVLSFSWDKAAAQTVQVYQRAKEQA